MLQGVRDNMKGTVVLVVIAIFVIPMVLTGVNSSFLGSVAGTNAATVEGKSISNSELARGIYYRRQSLVAQTGADASADFLSDENLRPQVLQQLTERAALVRIAEKNGMGASDKRISKEILQQEGFKTDSKFDKQKYQQILRQNGFTPATYKTEVQSDVLIGQQGFGLNYSSFVTDAEIDALVKISEQKRDFYSVKIPGNVIKDEIIITPEELQTYYDENATRFLDPEKLKVSYLELSIDELAKTADVSDEDVQAQFDQELETFNSATQYEVSHILIEEEDLSKFDEIRQKLDAGESFADLANLYSDDLATKDSGGRLGVMTQGMFPDAFEKAVLALDEGQVSELVKTDSGTHLIRADKKNVSEAPKFEDRKESIKSQLARVLAEEEFVQSLDLLGELTFSASDLSDAASQLGLNVKESSYFQRNSGAGIATEASVRDIAFSDDVLGTENNSKVIELGNDRAIVLRINEHVEEKLKPLDIVSADIETTLIAEKKIEKLETLVNELESKAKSGSDIEAIAKESEYEFKSHEKANRQDISVDREVSRLAFDMTPSPEGITFNSSSTRDGSYLLVGLKSVTDGQRSDMDDQQFDNLKRQLSSQNASLEQSSFEALIISSADINIK